MSSLDIDNIKRLLQNKKEVCIFVGAGASIMYPTCLPSFQELNNQLLSCLEECLSTRENFQTSLKRIHTKPEQLLQIIWDSTDGNFNPVECFQYATPNRNHYLLAELINQGINCIVTPNFDPCLERALEKRKICFDLFDKIPSASKEANELIRAIKGKKVTIWKPHGDCREPQTLCYTRTKVAKLSNSRYLREIFSYIIKNYNMLFLGYSGYDDDFFPILYENLPSSKKQVIWNVYKKPTEDEPCLLLKKASSDNFQLWVGDMTDLLDNLSEKSDIKIPLEPVLDCSEYLEKQFDTVVKSKKMAILSKYLYDFGLVDEACKIWREGLALPKKQIAKGDKLRFKMNLGEISKKEAYQKALEKECYDIAEIALENLLMESIDAKDYRRTQHYLKNYLEKCKGRSQQYFKKSRYYRFLYMYEANLKDGMVLTLKEDFERAYQALWKDGEVIEAVNLMISHYGAIAAYNQGNLEILEDSISKINQLVPYGENSSIANAYYYVANLAVSIAKREVALIYHEKCIHAMELCCANGLYEEERRHELWSFIYHQGSLISDDWDISLRKEQLALSEAEQLQDKKRQIYHKAFIYSRLCSLYMRDNYKLAVEYGMQALEFARRSKAMQSVARTYTYLAIADAKHGKRERAIQKFRKSYEIHKQIGEGLGYFYTALDECEIDISQVL